MGAESIDALFSRRRHGDTKAIRTSALEAILALYYAADTDTQVRFSIERLLRASDGVSLRDDLAELRAF